MNQTERLKKLVAKLRRKASKATALANRFGASGAVEACKTSLGEAYAYGKAADYLYEIVRS